MSLQNRLTADYTRQLIIAYRQIISRMSEYATGVGGSISSMSGLLEQSDLTTDEKTTMRQIGQAVSASIDAVTRLRLLIEAADAPGDMGTAKADFVKVLAE